MIDSERDNPVPVPGEARLCADDQRLLDALMESHLDRNYLSAVSADDNRRLDAISNTLNLLRDYPVEDASETLLHATLARIDRYETAQAERMNFESQQERRGWGKFSQFRIRVPDFITVAAVILIGVSVCWPMLSSIRHESMKTTCRNNLQHLGYAFGQYASDHNGSLPLAMAGPSLPWDRVCNVLNLEPLVNGNYCEAHHFNCPGHAHRTESTAIPNSSYSYRTFAAAGPTGWGTTRLTVILGDLNPIVDAAQAGRFVPPMSVSLNHAGRGQHVLWTDGSSQWLNEPMVGRRDNIWLPHGASRLKGGETPTDEADIFLTQ